ncbi:MAG: GTPase Era [Micrococcaceae bacterium]
MVDNFKAGFVAFIGRPNTGKSTLTNAMVGEKVAITSAKPQTTRRAIRGIVNNKSYQLIIVDTPGLHRPRTLLGERLNAVVESTVASVEVLGFCVPADEAIGPGDRFIAENVIKSGSKRPMIAIVTKADKVSSDQLAAQLMAVHSLGEELLKDGWAEIIPVSAINDYQVDKVADLLANYLPKSPKLYPDDEYTDETIESMIAEYVREAALEGVHDELPHSLAVEVEEYSRRENRPEDKPLTDISVSLFVERNSQKAIIIGKKGSRLREIGQKARKNIEELLQTQVFLDIRVKVAKEWQRDPKQLNRLGF